jgi:threonine dehydrogenase-like Zn-dependent dehydrogenase
MALRLRGAEVYGMDIVEADSARPKWLAHIGGEYIDGREVSVDKINAITGPIDLIFDATGVPKLEFNLLEALAYNGAYVVTGVPSGDRPIEISGAELIRQLVLKNQLILGSVNNPRAYFQMAVDDLAVAQLRWGDHVARLITHRRPYTDFIVALTQHEADEIKVVLEWRV